MAQASSGSGPSRKRSGGGRTSKGSTAKASSAKRSTAKGSKAKSTSRSSAAAGRSDKSVEAFREALDRSVTLSRDRLQEVVDEAVKRGRMTRTDANELISNLVSRGRQHTDDLMKDLERLIDQARKEVDTRVEPARRRATTAAGRVGRAARDAADRPLARADRIRRRAGGPGFPISAYDQLTATQVKSRLTDLGKPELRKVRTREKAGKARKSVLAEIEKRLR
jgi:polyhydroxyalkanoate synthesis regulator phasin